MPVPSGVVLGHLPRLLVRPLPLGVAVGLAVVLGLSLGTPPARTAALPTARPPTGAAVCDDAHVDALAGEVLIAGLPGVIAPNHPLVADLIDLQVGGVLIEKSNVRNAAQVRRLVGALRDGSDRPLLVTTDEEPGRVSNFGEVLGRFSAARTLAKRGTPEDVEVFARQFGVELSNLGMDVVFGPVADADDGPATGLVGDRSFSGEPVTARAYAQAYARGLWTGGVLPAPKHFPGAGRARAAAPGELPRLDVDAEELRRHDLVPFRALVHSGVRMLMVGNVVVDALSPELPASLAPRAYALARGLGFSGVAVTAALDDPVVAERWDYGESVVRAVAAGADAVLVADGGKARLMRDALTRAVTEGRLPAERLAQAAGRMLELKGVDPSRLTCPAA